MVRIRSTPRQSLALFVDGPLAAERRLVDTAPDGNPRARLTPVDAEGVVYERADWGHAGQSLR